MSNHIDNKTEKKDSADNHISKMLIGIFCLLSFIPVIGMLVAGPTPAGANEVLSAPPQLITEDGQFNASVLTDISHYVNDHFFMRNNLITAHNMLTTEVFSTTMSDSVFVGKDGWLFYGEDLEDITDSNPLMDEELLLIADRLYSIQQWCEAGGKQFVFTIAPNKSSLYPQYLQFEPQKSKSLNTNAKRLEKVLQEKRINYVNLYNVFAKNETPRYLKHDSHWNNQGAALAADSILAALEKNSNYSDGDFSTLEKHQGDLFNMLYPTRNDTELDGVYKSANGKGLEYEIVSGGDNPNSMLIESKSKSNGSAYVFRDSFGISLYPYLADSFETATFSRSVDFDVINAADADCVIIEIVERNLDYLLNIQTIDEATIVAVKEADDAKLDAEMTTSGSDADNLNSSTVNDELKDADAIEQALDTSKENTDAISNSADNNSNTEGSNLVNNSVESLVEDRNNSDNGDTANADKANNDNPDKAVDSKDKTNEKLEDKSKNESSVTDNTKKDSMADNKSQDANESPTDNDKNKDLKNLDNKLESTATQESVQQPEAQEAPEEAPPTPAELKAKAQGFIGSSASALKKAIGKPKSSSYAPSCLGDGEDGELYYDGFVVYTYKEGKHEEVTYVG